MLIDPMPLNRRVFLRRVAQLSAAGAATPLGLNLAAIGEAAAQTASDYKALVCVFLYGGNDHANTVVSYDEANYERYRGIRNGGAGSPALALDRSALAATRLRPQKALSGGLEFALHPVMTGMTDLFNRGQMAVLLNVGPLIQPITREQFFNPDRNRHPLPPRLMSHNDQQSVWQAQGAEGVTRGWGGNLGDLALASNGASIFTCISASGNAVFLNGQEAVQYQVTRDGPVSIYSLADGPHGLTGSVEKAAMLQRYREALTETRTHVLENEYNRITRRAVDAQATLRAALNSVPALRTSVPGLNPLASDLMIVARMIAARQALGVRRQVFLVSLGGFDLHDRLMEEHPVLLNRVSQALQTFYQATVELGVSDKVTAFTASEFGRALTSNGNGTDHGWGGHQFIIGGAVRGQAFYGSPPPVSVGNSINPEDQWHIGQGRLIPSTSVDQYAATLARWFGLSDSHLNSILPNLKNFGAGAYPTNLGFMG